MFNNRSFLSSTVIQFIHDNRDASPVDLILKYTDIDGIDIKLIAHQILGRKIAREKFPFLLDYDQYIYPPKISLEQASSEATARYKARGFSGDRFCDLTGGMGLDSYMIGKNFKHVDYVERNPELCQLAERNFKVLGMEHVTVHNLDADKFLENNHNTYDLVYIDPSRRIEGQRRTSVRLLEPDIVTLQEKILAVADALLVKLSPMQDVTECVSLLPTSREVSVVAVGNEVKELLIKLDKEKPENTSIRAALLGKKEEKCLTASLEDVKGRSIAITPPQGLLYLPHPAILKCALQDHIAEKYNLSKLHKNTHIYTSSDLHETYPGRILEVIEITRLNKKLLKPYISDGHINVIVKNFPLTPAEIKKKLRVRDGGLHYLVAFTDGDNNKSVAICHKR